MQRLDVPSRGDTTKISTQRLLELLCRLFLGGLLLYSGAVKVTDPAGFANLVANYHILPKGLVNIFALVLPWIELFTGACLAAGVWLPGAVLLTNSMLSVFLVALLYNTARGLDVDCGCFSTVRNAAEKSPMAWYILRDLLFLAPALVLAIIVFKGKKEEFPAKDQASAPGGHSRL